MSTLDFEAARGRMLREQLQCRGIHDRRVLAAMAKVARHRFVPEESIGHAYADRALPIDCRQTISQPYIVALMSEALELSGRETVLEIGTGSGYQTAVVAELAKEVVTIERHQELSQRAGKLLSELDYKNVRLLVGDGTLGCPGHATFDRIIITAAAAQCPAALFGQLEEGGVLVMPLGGRDHQTLQQIRKVAGRTQTTNLSPCRFVPLVGAHGWQEP